jgi:hypothetical protein
LSSHATSKHRWCISQMRSSLLQTSQRPTAFWISSIRCFCKCNPSPHRRTQHRLEFLHRKHPRHRRHHLHRTLRLQACSISARSRSISVPQLQWANSLPKQLVTPPAKRQLPPHRHRHHRHRHRHHHHRLPAIPQGDRATPAARTPRGAAAVAHQMCAFGQGHAHNACQARYLLRF